MSWFRRPPTPQARMDAQEARIVSAWGHTEQSWSALTDQERTTARTNYTKAPRYVG